MWRTNGNSKRTAKLMALAMLMAASAAAQTKAAPSTSEVSERRIVVSIPDHKLALIEDGVVKVVYPVATGKESTPSPVGTFKVINRVQNPTYYHEGKVIEPGPQNPLGNRWMGLSQKGYGIHGTNAPKSIGKSASHGCIRMAKADLEQLFTMVRVGDVVEIRGERDEELARLFGSEPVVVAQNRAEAPTVVGGQ